MLIIPAIDLKKGRCVRLTQGAKESTKIYNGDPAEIAAQYEAEGATRLHVVNLDGAFGDSDSENIKAARRIFKAVTIPVQFGGGITGTADVERLLDTGARYVIVGTLAQEQPDLLKEMVKRFGSKIIVGIDAKDGVVRTRGWEQSAQTRAADLALAVATAGVGRIVYTDIARDGMLTGVNLAATSEIARTSGLRVTASGGVGSLDDLQKLKEIEADGVDSVIVGKALYEGRFTLKEALNVA
ncbi:MAG TPA: 1-(5-phosphoribosyl)-5-[(5-phosphoribosylamino)methylideneamino]imidazole-4-carboxamide isomerase [Blastocatellia bacterium]|nr:1-(5-phosphoribosyl)-5-[(5-phosphoribosylamino)methylideneamino]imidazole-4-carboxamide isomerase [Blastocatellia bacterium]